MENNINKTKELGEQIKELRSQLEMTQEELARCLYKRNYNGAIRREAIVNIEKGKRQSTRIYYKLIGELNEMIKEKNANGNK